MLHVLLTWVVGKNFVLTLLQAFAIDLMLWTEDIILRLENEIC